MRCEELDPRFHGNFVLSWECASEKACGAVRFAAMPDRQRIDENDPRSPANPNPERKSERSSTFGGTPGSGD
jgi:hypothetical protein